MTEQYKNAKDDDSKTHQDLGDDSEEDFEEDKVKKVSEFALLLEDSFRKTRKSVSAGDKIKSEILSIGREDAFVSTGTMHDGIVRKKDLMDAEGNLKYKVGDTLDLYVTQVRGTEIFLSASPTAKNVSDDLEDAFDKLLPVEGRVAEVCKGGFRVLVLGKIAFCPISHMDLRRIETPEDYIGKRFEFLITQFSERGKNVVVSRRKLLEEQKGLSETAFVEENRIGGVVPGKVTRLEKFGAFVELEGGVEGLLHISELSWSRVEDPKEVVTVGQQIQVKILRTEEKDGHLKISLSLKQAGAEPWQNLSNEFHEGDVVQGKVTRCLKFGAFVEIKPGVEGLIPLSEMSYTQRVNRSDDLVKEGEQVFVKLKEIHFEERKILLSLKDAGADPWALVPQRFPVGTLFKGVVERREPYGIFVQIEAGVVGLLPKSKAMEDPQFPFEKLKIKDTVTLQIGEINLEERRISLRVPSDAGHDDWKSFTPGGSGSFGTLGDQFRALLDKKKSSK